MKKLLLSHLIILLIAFSLYGQSEYSDYVKGQALTAFTGDGEFPIITLHENGSMVSIKVDKTTHLPNAIIYREKLDAEPVVLLFDEGALPTKIYTAGYTFIVLPKSDTTFQIGMIKPDGSTDIVNDVEIQFPKITALNDSLIFTMPGTGPSDECELSMPEMDVLVSALTALKYAGTALSAISCAAALIPPVGVALILPCGAAALDIYTNYFNEDAKGAVASAEVLNAAGNFKFFTDSRNSVALLELQKISGKANIAGVMVYGLQKALESIKKLQGDKKESTFLDDMKVEYDSFVGSRTTPQELDTKLDSITAKGVFAIAREADEKVAKLKQDKEKLEKTLNQSNFKKIQADLEKLTNQIKSIKSEYVEKANAEIKKSPRVNFPFAKYDSETGYRVHSITLAEMTWLGDRACFLLNWVISISDKRRVDSFGFPYYERVYYVEGDYVFEKGSKEKKHFTLSTGSKENYQTIRIGGTLNEIENLRSIKFTKSSLSRN